MSAGLNLVRKWGISGSILAESGLQFLNHAIKVLFWSAIFVSYPAALRQCLPCKRSSPWRIRGGQSTTWHSSKQKNVSCWCIFLGQYHPYAPVISFHRKMEIPWKIEIRFFYFTILSTWMAAGHGTTVSVISLGVNCIFMSNHSQYTPVPKMQISAIRRVHFFRFKRKTYPHQLDSHRRTLWILLSLTFVPGLLSLLPNLAGVLPEPSPSHCRAGIWGAEWANQDKTCFLSLPALEFPAAGPDGERQRFSALSVHFTGRWKVSDLFCRRATLSFPPSILS